MVLERLQYKKRNTSDAEFIYTGSVVFFFSSVAGSHTHVIPLTCHSGAVRDRKWPVIKWQWDCQCFNEL